MARALIGRTVRRLRTERRLTQQALAARLGISASYLNLIEHDQRAVTASLLIKLGETLRVDLATLSGRGSASSRSACARSFADPLLAADAVPEAEVAELAAARRTRRARCWRCIAPGAWRARTPAASRCRPGGASCCRTRRRATSSTTAATISPTLEAAAEAIAAELRRRAGRDEPRHRRTAAPDAWAHGDGAAAGRRAAPLRSRRAAAGACRRRCRARAAASTWPSSSPCWRRAMRWRRCWPRPRRPRRKPAMLIRVGLLNYVAGALLMPYAAFLDAAQALRHDMEALAARFGVSFEQACHRLSTLQRPGRARGAVLLRARRSGGECVQALLRRRLSVRALWRIVPALGRAHGLLPARRGAGPGRGTAGRRGLSVLRAHRDAAGDATGASRGRCMSWRWAAASRMPRRSHMRTGWIWSGRRSASACRAGCAIARTAAAARFRRWNTGWPWIPIVPVRRHTGSKRGEDEMPARRRD